MQASSLLVTLGFLVIAANSSRSAGCRNIAGLRELGLPKGTHYNATPIAVGDLETGTASANEVALCRVVGSMPYGSKAANTLKFELWLPENSKYNGRYVSVGEYLQM